MALSKLEMQQMLREMNVKFHADESYEELKQRLQHENHSRWLKSVAGASGPDAPPRQRVIRKRRKSDQPPSSTGDAPSVKSSTGQTDHPVRSRMNGKNGQRPERHVHRSAIDKPAAGKPWKQAADGTEPFNRKKNVFTSVLRRCRNCCERCGAAEAASDSQPGLEPYHILPLDEGGEHSTKNVVALCATCLAALQTDPDPKTIKELKRKTRSKLYDSAQVVKKKRPRTWQRPGSGS